MGGQEEWEGRRSGRAGGQDWYKHLEGQKGSGSLQPVAVWSNMEVNQKGPFSIKLDGVGHVDNRPSTGEAPLIGRIHPFIKIAVTLQPVLRFKCPSRFRKS